MPDTNEICDRFGAPIYYEGSFHNLDRSNLREDFTSFHARKRYLNPSSSDDAYEIARQQFLKLLGQHKMIWQQTNEQHDLDVEVSRIYCHDRHEYLAFMRIQPRGFRGERVVPVGIEIVFHVLIGRVVFTNRGRVRKMIRGQSTTISSKAAYSIRCLNEDQPAYLIFRVINNNRKQQK